MLSKNQIKKIQSLQQKKFRKLHQQFVAEGTKIVAEILEQKEYILEGVYATEEWLDNQEYLPENVPFQQVSKKDLDRISGLRTANQVLAVVVMPSNVIRCRKPEENLHLVLDNINDPGNLGTIIRIADWFGIRQIHCSPTCVEYTNPKVIQASMGSFLRVGIQHTDLAELLDQYPNVPSYGAVLEGQSIYTKPLEAKGFLFIGNESKGLSEQLIERLTHRLTIPKFGGAESLNAAVATGILCAWFRQ